MKIHLKTNNQMKTKIPYRIYLLAFCLGVIMLLKGSSFAQQKPDDQAKSKKTISIYITKEVDGNTVVIDTTFVTEGDFDVDAFLDKKGVQNDMPEGLRDMDEDIVIRHPGDKEFNWNDSEGNLPDSVMNDIRKRFEFDDSFDNRAPGSHHRGLPYYYKFHMPDEFAPMEGPQFEDRMENILRSLGLEDMMPFGDMKQIVVKKKHNGKKVIISFNDKDGDRHEHRNRNKKEERVIIYENGDQSMSPRNQERIIIKRNPDKKVIIKEDADEAAPAKKEKQVIIIKKD
jgi:hypothetical protein